MPTSSSPRGSAPLLALLVGSVLEQNTLAALLCSHADIVAIATVDTVPEAREMLTRQVIHLVFLDLDLPSENALALLPHVPPEVRVILITARERGLVRALQADPANHLDKPVTAAALAIALDHVRRDLRS